MADKAEHTSEIDTQSVVVTNDNTILDSEVWAEVDDVSTEVLKTVELPFLSKILWHLNTEQAWYTVHELMKKREAINDNQQEKKEAA